MEDVNQTVKILSPQNGSETEYQCSGATDDELELYAQLSFWLGGNYYFLRAKRAAFAI